MWLRTTWKICMKHHESLCVWIPDLITQQIHLLWVRKKCLYVDSTSTTLRTWYIYPSSVFKVWRAHSPAQPHIPNRKLLFEAYQLPGLSSPCLMFTPALLSVSITFPHSFFQQQGFFLFCWAEFPPFQLPGDGYCTNSYCSKQHLHWVSIFPEDTNLMTVLGIIKYFHFQLV